MNKIETENKMSVDTLKPKEQISHGMVARSLSKVSTQHLLLKQLLLSETNILITGHLSILHGTLLRSGKTKKILLSSSKMV